MRFGIIGGTGVYDPRILSDIREIQVETAYGAAFVQIGTYKGREMAFLARHGRGHTIPPHLINYRANIAALKELGVERVLATSAVGSMNPDMKPGDCVILDQFIDFTKGREHTFFCGGDEGVVHIDFTQPYCPEIRETLVCVAKELGVAAHDRGCYVCTEGPRFETPAEIRMFAGLGGDVVGMTNVPEVVLAREAGMCYGVMATVTNWAAGISRAPLTHGEVVEMMTRNTETIRRFAMRTIELLGEKRGCNCGNARS